MKKKIKKGKGKINLLKNKRNIFIFTICLIVLIGIGSFFAYKSYVKNKQLKEEKRLVTEIKSHYNSYVTILKDTNIYNKNKNEYKISGKISSGFNLELEKTDIKNSNQQYFKIKDDNYYVYYKDVKKIKEYNKNIYSDNYLVFNNNIITGDTTKFINNDTYIEINKSYELPIMYQDENNYYVSYLNNIYGVEKSSIKELVEKENTADAESNYISILNYGTIKTDKLKEQLEYLKNEGYYTINLDDYKKWLSGNIRLKQKAILLTLESENNDITNTLKEYNFNIEVTKDSGIKFISNNKSTNKESKLDNLNRYEIKDTTTLDEFKKMCSGEEIKPKNITTSSVTNNTVARELPAKDGYASKIAVLNYHFFYDSSLGEGCNEGICLEVSKFKEQLQYLKDNGFKTLKMEEFRAWMYGEIELPARSVLLTIDDGAMGTGAHNGNKLIPILEEYDMYATLFLITGWWDISNYQSSHLDVESHTNDMHTGNLCSNQPRGAQLLCSTKEQVLADLRKSIEITKSNTAFCFPFYAYNNSAIESIKEVGFKLAFIGGNTKATRSVDKYKIPRYPIYSSTTLNQFINMVN